MLTTFRFTLAMNDKNCFHCAPSQFQWESNSGPVVQQDQVKGHMALGMTYIQNCTIKSAEVAH